MSYHICVERNARLHGGSVSTERQLIQKVCQDVRGRVTWCKNIKNKIRNRILCSMCKIPNFVLASWVVLVFKISGCGLSSTWGLATVLVQIFCCVSIWEFYVSLLCRCCYFVLTDEILSFILPPPPQKKRRKKNHIKFKVLKYTPIHCSVWVECEYIPAEFNCYLVVKFSSLG